jgi:hypothetical protein
MPDTMITDAGAASGAPTIAKPRALALIRRQGDLQEVRRSLRQLNRCLDALIELQGEVAHLGPGEGDRFAFLNGVMSDYLDKLDLLISDEA